MNKIKAEDTEISLSAQHAFRRGVGDWYKFDIPLEQIYELCENWRKQLEGIDKPWLCWNVDPEWSYVQQKLVNEIGWTPIVGGDTRAQKPKLIPNAVSIDFAQGLDLPKMMFHFPLEFVHRFVPKMAFWHSDLLCRLPLLRSIAEEFENLPDGEVAAVLEHGGRRNYFNKYRYRFWELIGCTTAEASLNQFENACGWWKSYYCHPNCADENDRKKRKRYFYDHGGGIYYWHKNYGGKVRRIKLEPLLEGHCSMTRVDNYKRISPRDARRNVCSELSMNFDLQEVCGRLDLEGFLDNGQDIR